jgi:hypothetical protein
MSKAGFCQVTLIAHYIFLVYGITKGDGSGYNRTVLITNTKSKAGGAIINGEYRSQETKAST